MIIKASERGHAVELGLHLTNDRDNDVVEVHSVRGFIAQDVVGAVREISWLEKNIRSKKPLFSVSFSAPKHEECGDDVYLQTIEEAERRLGLTGQPRVVVFHEKFGRRHAHAVWSYVERPVLARGHLSMFSAVASICPALFCERVSLALMTLAVG